MASFRAQLSPKEECALRRIVLGLSDVELGGEHVRRLIALGLVEVRHGSPIVTEAGVMRYRELPQYPAARSATPRSLKSRILPF